MLDFKYISKFRVPTNRWGWRWVVL